MDYHGEPLARLVDYFQSLTAESVENMQLFYTEDAYFRDPFNDVAGIDRIKLIFSGMFDHLQAPRFVVTESVAQNDTAVLFWDFTFRMKTLMPNQIMVIRGSSHLRFATDGRVQYHRDYWDAAGELYEKLPVLGMLMRWLKKRAG